MQLCYVVAESGSRAAALQKTGVKAASQGKVQVLR